MNEVCFLTMNKNNLHCLKKLNKCRRLMNTIMTAMQCDAIIHEFSEKATRVKEINSFLCLLKNGIFHLSVFDPEATKYPSVTIYFVTPLCKTQSPTMSCSRDKKKNAI